MDLYKMDAVFTGSVVGGGISSLYSTTPGVSLTAVKSFWQSCAAVMAGQTTITVPNTGDIVDSATGALTGVWSSGTVGTYTGGGSGAYAAGIGASIGWQTSGIVRGHKVRGRTFIVPLALNQWESDGTLSAACLTALNSAASTFITAGAGQFCVWTRPSAAGAGAASTVVSARVADRTGWLASRKR